MCIVLADVENDQHVKGIFSLMSEYVLTQKVSVILEHLVYNETFGVKSLCTLHFVPCALKIPSSCQEYLKDKNHKEVTEKH